MKYVILETNQEDNFAAGLVPMLKYMIITGKGYIWNRCIQINCSDFPQLRLTFLLVLLARPYAKSGIFMRVFLFRLSPWRTDLAWSYSNSETNHHSEITHSHSFTPRKSKSIPWSYIHCQTIQTMTNQARSKCTSPFLFQNRFHYKVFPNISIQLHTRLQLKRVIQGLLHVYVCFFEKEIQISISRLRLVKNHDAKANKDPSIQGCFMQARSYC